MESENERLGLPTELAILKFLALAFRQSELDTLETRIALQWPNNLSIMLKKTNIPTRIGPSPETQGPLVGEQRSSWARVYPKAVLPD